jgi:hypothetical protein
MQFNKFSFLRSALAAVLGLTLAAAAMAQPKFLLRWGHYLPDGPFLQLEKDFAAKIEKRTNGQVKIEITYAGGLGKDTELLMLTARGAIDMTATAPGYNPDQLRYWRAFQTPMLFTSTKQVIDLLETDPARGVQGEDGYREWLQAITDEALQRSHQHFEIPAVMDRCEALIPPAGSAAAAAPEKRIAAASRRGVRRAEACAMWIAPQGNPASPPATIP